MTKHEIYEALKADGAKLPKAERFMALDNLKAIYTERFGVSPDEPAKTDTTSPSASSVMSVKSVPSVPVRAVPIPLLRFIESGWCPALKRSYTRGLYRPKNSAEYQALKPFAEEVV